MPSVLQHLGRACREARLAAELRQIDIAVSADLSHTIVGRFENGVGRLRDLDSMVAAYAEETGVTELDLWVAALLAWQEERT